ncbi:inositol monophosphatase [Cryobacterium sp. TMT1-21]|uniref:Inositol-1-monophosphatase n=1 Tax=Cryobacterium shii TaxID=1259235 RepID=A0AAQ2HFB4_9MICO|nr:MULTISPECIES: inositol monophosphatase family protein [Cryobacterium]TFC45594.1 inositol monophosphatase [Cryobacterium shii]TFC85806.1 inositol monophosphatase [Cryobacterium sp. TmT2-59]TFD16461.1 inositol monophosphatase [Cryobacterium sp. TMT1-21]TFD23585.1 inositol monophosphatase [Cryobacterium sp. TMT2-23]TFD37522.1 inositol monophosphatase [Cryobacterium sp. TMT2-10]
MTTPGSTELLRLAQDAALAAGELAARRRAEGVQIAASKSSPEDIVTKADRETETLIRRLLAAARPDDGFFGEESEATPGTSGLTWVVDPIDGTVNYLYRIPAWAVSIAVVEGDPDPATWRTLAGAVRNPSGDELFSASVGAGAWLGESRLRVPTAAPVPLALLGTGFSYRADERLRQADVVRGLIGRVRDIRRIGAASLDLCSVAAGRLDLYYERGLKPWDHAAGALVAREAGARVGGFGADREGIDLVIAGAPDLYSALEPILADLFGEFMDGDRRP